MPKRVTDYRQTLLRSLTDPVEAAHYLEAAIEDSDSMFLTALRDVAEAKQMSAVAKGAGVAREAIYRMLSPKGNPSFRTVKATLNFLGLKLGVSPATQQSAMRILSHSPSTQVGSVRVAKSATPDAQDPMKALTSLHAQLTIQSNRLSGHLSESTPRAAQKSGQPYFNPNHPIAIFPHPSVPSQSGVTERGMSLDLCPNK